jgi:cysteinyl-tRNA synthetase
MRANLLDQMQQVRADHDRATLPRSRQNRILHPPDAHWVESRERLIEINHLGRVQQAASNRQLLFHAARQFSRQRIDFVRQFQFFQQLPADGFIIFDLVNPRREIQMLLNCQVIEQSRFVGQESQLAFGGDFIRPQFLAADAHAAAGSRDDARQAAQCAGLTGAIWPHQSKHLPRLDGKGEIIHRDQFAIKLRQAFDLNHVLRPRCYSFAESLQFKLPGPGAAFPFLFRTSILSFTPFSMGLRFFNTLSRSVQDFVPLDPAGKRAGMYCCGPTVYDFAHIGNWRTFVFSDLVRRYLEFKGYDVRHVMNITDIDDKIIKRVREANTPLPQFTGKFEAAFFEDLKSLNCRMPHQTPRATEHIPEIVGLIEQLVQKGLAYKTSDGSVYFSIEKYRGSGHQYGQLVNLNFDEMRVGERVRSDEYAKEAVADFALWKARVPEDGQVFWPSPWSEGRPGWHIECSAMSMKLLEPAFDLHLGGEDLIFPHHEDEIAQSEGAGVQPPGRGFVKYWLHGAHLLVEGKKMSKSLGNFFTLRDLLSQGFSGREVRYLLLTAHYRGTFNFTLEGLRGAQASLQRIDEYLGKLREIARGKTAQSDEHIILGFTNALDDDLNIAAAWGAIFDWITEINRELAANKMDGLSAAAALAAWNKIDSVLGVGMRAEVEIPAEISSLMAAREAARKAKDFKTSDALRDELKSKGWTIEDTPKGPRLKHL